MTQSVDLRDTRKKALTRGFWNGMAAPLVRFSSLSLPAEARPMEYRPLQRRVTPPSMSDWVRVGDSLRTAVRKHRESNG